MDDMRSMLHDIEDDVLRTQGHIGKSALDADVMAAIRRVQRHAFVPAELQDQAYANHPLQIGHLQTISQPYIVALMTDLLQLNTHTKILEIGTGSGYQTAIAAELAEQVYTIEIIEPLAKSAQQRLTQYANIHFKVDDGYLGWEAHSPYDAIIVTAAAKTTPKPLLKQLNKNGRMVIPVGRDSFCTHLLLIEKNAHDKITEKQILPVSFVPLTRHSD